MTTVTRLPSTFHAIRAAQHVGQWGFYAARQYCIKRSVHPALLCLARQLESAQTEGV
jgi:hypothetical protein